MNIILFILSAFGLTNILAFGKIFDKIRPPYYYFTCTMCMGFTVGIFLFLLFWLSGIHLFNNIYIGSLLFGFISSGTSYLLSSVFNDYGINIKHN